MLLAKYGTSGLKRPQTIVIIYYLFKVYVSIPEAPHTALSTSIFLKVCQWSTLETLAMFYVAMVKNQFQLQIMLDLYKFVGN